MKLVDLVGIQIEATTGAPLLLLREQGAPHRVVPIFVGGPEAASIAVALSGQVPPRPFTHDLMVSLVEGLSAHIDSVEVNGMDDGTFLATISVSGPGGEQRLDTRPSDAIALAVRVDAPLFISDEVLDLVGAIVHEVPDEESIDEAVADFRDFLDGLDPADFAEPSTVDAELILDDPEPNANESAPGIHDAELVLDEISDAKVDDDTDASGLDDDATEAVTSDHVDFDEAELDTGSPDGDLEA